MDIDLIFKVAGIGIIVSVLYQVLARSGREDQAMMTALIGLVAVMMIVVSQVGELFTSVKNIFGL
jgi:stage III sporulation protein AC